MCSDLHEEPSTIAVSEMRGAADMMRLLRLFVAQGKGAGPMGVALTANSPFFQAAYSMLDETPTKQEPTRTTLMALRDLVWRVDSLRSVLASQDIEPAVAETLTLLDTSDIHLFLKPEP